MFSTVHRLFNKNSVIWGERCKCANWWNGYSTGCDVKGFWMIKSCRGSRTCTAHSLVHPWGRSRNLENTCNAVRAISGENESCSVMSSSLWPHMGYTIHGILQARILECIAFPFFKGASQARDRTQVCCIAGRFFTSWATRGAQEYWSG